jgi:3-hydroxy-9,10-secoandrosta-1,3,5(10)-triene-9,17-dione monooxygenase
MPDAETKLRYRRNAAFGTKLCSDAVDLLQELMGANGIYDNQPLARMMRDTRAAAAHISLGWDAQMANYGLAVLGGEINMPTL